MIIRTFKIPADIDLRLANRAEGQGQNKADLVWEYIDDMFDDGPPLVFNTNSQLVIRSFYLTEDQDTKLAQMSLTEGRSKGELFRGSH